MSINNDKEDTPSPCQNAGCPFWGRQATEGLCSKCYNTKQKDQQKLASASNGTASSASLASSSVSASSESPSKVLVSESSKSEAASAMSVAAPSTESVPQRKVQENRNRCFQCNKKVGLTGIECRCGYVFCGAHRYPDTHSCDFDFKKHDRDLLAKSNEKIAGTKLADKL